MGLNPANWFPHPFGPGSGKGKADGDLAPPPLQGGFAPGVVENFDRNSTKDKIDPDLLARWKQLTDSPGQDSRQQTEALKAYKSALDSVQSRNDLSDTARVNVALSAALDAADKTPKGTGFFGRLAQNAHQGAAPTGPSLQDQLAALLSPMPNQGDYTGPYDAASAAAQQRYQAGVPVIQSAFNDLKGQLQGIGQNQQVQGQQNLDSLLGHFAATQGSFDQRTAGLLADVAANGGGNNSVSNTVSLANALAQQNQASQTQALQNRMSMTAQDQQSRVGEADLSQANALGAANNALSAAQQQIALQKAGALGQFRQDTEATQRQNAAITNQFAAQQSKSASDQALAQLALASAQAKKASSSNSPTVGEAFASTDLPQLQSQDPGAYDAFSAIVSAAGGQKSSLGHTNALNILGQAKNGTITIGSGAYAKQIQGVTPDELNRLKGYLDSYYDPTPTAPANGGAGLGLGDMDPALLRALLTASGQ